MLEEKLSYINQAPFNVGDVNTLFVQSASTFPIAIGSSKVNNLGGVELRGTFVPIKPKYPHGAIDFQGEFGSSFQSYFVSLEIGKAF